MDRRLFISVLVTYLLVGQGNGNICSVSRARLNPTLYRNVTCPGECCSDLSFKFCCDEANDVNIPVVIAFSIGIGVISIAVFFIFCCCYESSKKKEKVSKPEEEDDESYHGGQNGDHYTYHIRIGSDHHGYPNTRVYPPHDRRNKFY